MARSASRVTSTALLVIGALALVAGVVYDLNRTRLHESPVESVAEVPDDDSTVATTTAPPSDVPVMFAVLGDALSMPLAEGAAPGWIERFAADMCWTLADRFTQPDAGYTKRATPDPAVDTSFITRVPDVVARAPQVVIVQGGAADVLAPPDVITAAAAEVFGTLRAGLGERTLIVAVGPVPTPGSDGAALSAVSAAVSAAAGQFGVAFIDPVAEGWLPDPLFFTPETALPNDQGNVEIAERLEADFRQPGISPTAKCG